MQGIPELKAPFIVDFEVTQRCSFRCFFCEADIPYIKPASEMETNEILRIIEKISEAEIPNIFFTGGEPLLRNDLPDLIKYCFKLGLDPCVSTNGFFFDGSEIDRIIDAGLKSMQVSIHGPKDIHDAVVGMKEAYEITMRNVRKALKARVDVEIACVGLKENIEYIPTLVGEIASLGVKFFRLLRYISGYRKEMLKHIPPKTVVEKCIPEIRKAAVKHGIEVALASCPGLKVTPPYAIKGIHPIAFTCPAGKTSFAIMPNGDVYPCIFFKHRPEMYCGNILQDSVSKIWNAPAMAILRSLTPANYTGICSYCERKWACYSARCVAYNLTNDLYGDDLSCYVVREKLGLEVYQDRKGS